MSMDRITRSDSGGVCALTLSRPDKLNALDTETFHALDAHLAALEGEAETVGCVVLRGAGRAFCAGADLGGFGASPVDPEFKPGVIERLAALPQPVIAGIHGVCFTGGLELALACDVILADTTARFADTHGKWGFVGEWGIGQRLPRRIGQSAAKRMMLTAEEISASEAHRLGLVDVLVEAGALDEAVAEFAARVVGNSWHSTFAAKRIMRETDGMGIDEAIAWERRNHPGFSADHQERIARFTAKKGA